MAKADHRMNYEKMGDMAKAFGAAQKQLQETQDAMKAISQKLKDGALQGDGGTAFLEVMEQRLKPKLKNIDTKMGELAKDLGQAAQATQDGVRAAGNRFMD